MEEGQIVRHDGSIKKLERGRYNEHKKSSSNGDKAFKKDAHHFDNEQLKGLSAIREHMMARTQDMIEAHMGAANNSSPFQIMPPAPPQGQPPSLRGFQADSVFRRINSSKDNERDAKKTRFMDELGKHEQH